MLLYEVHQLARVYHWPEADILGLSCSRRRHYLALIEQDDDATLIGGAGGADRD